MRLVRTASFKKYSCSVLMTSSLTPKECVGSAFQLNVGSLKESRLVDFSEQYLWWDIALESPANFWLADRHFRRREERSEIEGNGKGIATPLWTFLEKNTEDFTSFFGDEMQLLCYQAKFQAKCHKYRRRPVFIYKISPIFSLKSPVFSHRLPPLGHQGIQPLLLAIRWRKNVIVEEDCC